MSANEDEVEHEIREIRERYVTPWERSFREQTERLRTASGMRQSDLAKALKDRYGLPFHQQTIQRIEKGERPIRLNEAYAIADLFGVSVVAMSAAESSVSRREVRYGVDSLRRKAAWMDELLSPSGDYAGEFLNELESLASMVGQDIADLELNQLDHHERWAVTFLLVGLSAWEASAQAQRSFDRLAGGNGEPAVLDVIPFLESLRQRFGVLESDAEDMNALYESLVDERVDGYGRGDGDGRGDGRGDGDGGPPPFTILGSDDGQ